MPNLARVGLFIGLVWVWAITAAFAPDKAEMEFYSAASQIIPLLLLVLLIEARLFDLPRFFTERRRGVADAIYDCLLALTILAVVIKGEFDALHALATGDATSVNAVGVYLAITSALAAATAIGLFGPSRADRAR